MTDVLIAVIAFAGTLVGSLGGILAANRLTVYRIERLEEKVDKHNKLIERTFILEGKMSEAEHDIIDIKRRLAS